MSIADEQFPDQRTRQSPECPWPDCGAAYNPRNDNGWANDGTTKLREYHCAVCGNYYVTAEIPLAPGSRIREFDENRVVGQRERARQRRGYKGGPPHGTNFRLTFKRLRWVARTMLNSRIVGETNQDLNPDACWNCKNTWAHTGGLCRSCLAHLPTNTRSAA